MAIERMFRHLFGVDGLRHVDSRVVAVFVARWLTDFIVNRIRGGVEYAYLARP
ncbi:hypothetical protein CABS03_05487 [Colletotrichum abscissum]|uniref:Uncharacterized protein n=1 Tax=Colletotrichum abscissum TaxID=1671311 RepID=A0A9Q0AZ70_9PEZI|nr:hypothetical protein CABS02_12129 [Colletotrichum abscissum]